MDENVVRNPAVFEGVSREEIETAPDKVKVPVCLVIGQRLKPQVAQPQAAVPLGAVLKDLLHALVQRPD